MSIVAVMRQAAIDAADQPPGLSFGVVWEERQGVGVVIHAQLKNAFGQVVWEAPYDRRGHRLTIGGGLRW